MANRTRLLASAAGYVVLVIASVVVMDWFQMTMAIDGHVGTIGIGLRSINVCQSDGVCASVSYGNLALRGSFPLAAAITFWGSLLTALLVVYQAGTRLLSGAASESLSSHGIKACFTMILGAAAAGFLFGPEGGSDAAKMMGLDLERTWAPVMLIAAHLLGMAVLRFAVSNDSADDEAPYVPIKVERPVTPATEQVVTGPLPTMPDHLRKKLSYMTVTAEITRAGIDARREDGTSMLVLWRDVVGVVARRLPPEHDGATFVDIVSMPGTTLRVMAWTRLTGEPLVGADDARARALVTLVISHCPTIKVDPKTRQFVDGELAAQLPDVATLGAHDARLA
ncbi:MAG: hypothetical protein JWP01_2663 [Myxococcales bacterium]|nr:hypothetical protein [Myxococcales bacterium]